MGTTAPPKIRPADRDGKSKTASGVSPHQYPEQNEVSEGAEPDAPLEGEHRHTGTMDGVDDHRAKENSEHTRTPEKSGSVQP